jgi:hypothetical protein
LLLKEAEQNQYINVVVVIANTSHLHRRKHTCAHTPAWGERVARDGNARGGEPRRQLPGEQNVAQLAVLVRLVVAAQVAFETRKV